MKKLNIAFIWHFHQPIYRENPDKDFLMPWVRLHATKDYLDMLYRIEKFPRLRVNFNISPTLTDSIARYLNGIQDIHSRLFLDDIENLKECDKKFILNNFFDANYTNMILTRPHYLSLYNKRYSEDEVRIENFTNQEYADIMTNYTLAWMDKSFVNIYPDLQALFDKEKDYTLEDRKRIYDISYDIMSRLPHAYREAQAREKIEISTNPYYHAILPLLLDTNTLPCAYKENLPENRYAFEQDARLQVEKALDRFEGFFGARPKGIWLSEHCISKKTVELLNDLGIKWTISDEGILANTLKKEFQRDFEGNLEDPFALCDHYKLKGNDKTNIIFANSFFSNLVSFGYRNYDAVTAANDFYEKIKTIQQKLDNSPRSDHLLTIAMDGENCWESYENDGSEFLDTLYGLLEDDETLETVLMSDYLDKAQKATKLSDISPGSWINRNFDLWIGEPVKNLAWKYLEDARKAFNEASKKIKDEELLILALREIHIAQGSDWFWWYGEPNESGQDHIFDHLFRVHLKNVYEILSLEYPVYLDIPLISIIGKPIRHPRRRITPVIDGCTGNNPDEWADAGYIFLPDNPTYSAERIVKGIYFGNDIDNIYFKFEINKNNIDENDPMPCQIYIYLRTENAQHLSPVRVISKTENMFPIIKNRFSHGLEVTFRKNEVYAPRSSKATSEGMWVLKPLRHASIAYKDCLELSIPFDELKIGHGEMVEFCVISSHRSVIDDIYPQDLLLNLVR